MKPSSAHTIPTKSYKFPALVTKKCEEEEPLPPPPASRLYYVIRCSLNKALIYLMSSGMKVDLGVNFYVLSGYLLNILCSVLFYICFNN